MRENTWSGRLRQQAVEVLGALAPVRDHALASGREALLTVSSLFAVAAQGLDRLRSQSSASKTEADGSSVRNGP